MGRYSELETILDNEDLSDEDYHKYNNELNALQAEINRKKQADIDAKNKSIQEAQERIKQLEAEGKMNEIVQEYGQRFAGDYLITDSFKVISSAFNPRNPNGPNNWQCNSQEEAVDKVNQLLYYRVYDHYFREKPL